ANGIVERFHRTLKSSLRARLSNNDWLEHLHWVLLGLRTAPKEDSGLSPAELTFGMQLVIPGQLLATSDFSYEPPEVDRLRLFHQVVPPVPFINHDNRGDWIHPKLSDAKFIFLRTDSARTAFQNPYEGPYEVLQAGIKTFKIKRGLIEEIVSTDRLKPAVVDTSIPVNVHVPRPKGRPRNKS
ncbi:Transposon Ty3-G Gag-Pol poly, partial [Paramuricea clavata]